MPLACYVKCCQTSFSRRLLGVISVPAFILRPFPQIAWAGLNFIRLAFPADVWLDYPEGLFN